MKHFLFFPILVSVIGLGAVLWQLGISAFILAGILTVLEVTLSFDNAIVNAKVLDRMEPKWRHRFITWGIPIAVIGTRFVLPLLIVSIAVFVSPWVVAVLAVTDPEEYGRMLEGVRPMISAFGGVFLLMVALKYFFDEAKDVHWIQVVEKYLAKWGRIEAIEIGIALIALAILSFAVPADQASILVAGIIGIILFIAMEGLAGSLGSAQKGIAAGGLSLFLYLNVLDAAFSLDGVIGAFALTVNLLVIVVGLGIGAYFVRSLTIYFVEKKTLHQYIYLEHGAHWAILGLAVSMFVGLVIHVPEVITGCIGLFFVVLAYLSSRKHPTRRN